MTALHWWAARHPADPRVLEALVAHGARLEAVTHVRPAARRAALSVSPVPVTHSPVRPAHMHAPL